MQCFFMKLIIIVILLHEVSHIFENGLGFTLVRFYFDVTKEKFVYV